MASFLFLQKKKKGIAGLLLCAVLCVFLFAPAEAAFAGFFSSELIPGSSESGTGDSSNGAIAKIFGFDKIGELIDRIIAGTGNTVLSVMGLSLTAAGLLFNWAIDISINNPFLKNNTFVETGWRVMRDLVNLFFIFILLYIAIATILRVEGFNTKKLLTNIIAIALLVNFSLVIAKFVIDASNIIALEFYNAITAPATPGGAPKNLGAIFAEGLRIQTIWDVQNPQSLGTNVELSLFSVIIASVMGSALIVVAAFVILAAAVMFVIRTVVLMIVMVLAPAGFLAMILPATQGYARKWWHALFSQSFFAPLYMVLFYALATMIQNADFNELLFKSKNESWADTFLNWGQQSALAMNFAFLIALAVGILVVAKQVGAYGSETAIAWGKTAQRWGQGKVRGGVRWAWKETGGRAASVAAQSRTMKTLTANAPRIGSLIYRGFDTAAKGYEKSTKAKVERRTAIGKRIAEGEGGQERLATFQGKLATSIPSQIGGARGGAVREATGIGIVEYKAGEELKEYQKKVQQDQQRVDRLKEEREEVTKNVEETRKLIAETTDIRPEEEQTMRKELRRLEGEIDKIDREIERRGKNLEKTKNWREVKEEKKKEEKEDKNA